MAAILQTVFSIVFSSMKMYEFYMRFPLNVFLEAQLTILQHWFR